MAQYDPNAFRTPGFMYGAEDTGNPVFPGNFDNFGYWEGIAPGQTLSIDDRIESQRRLYQKIIEAAQIAPGDVALEVACGRGQGVKWLMETVGPTEVHAVDASEHQVARAIATTEGMENVYIHHAPAEALPFLDNMFDRAFSLEAIQHFSSPELFAWQLGRVVRSSGTIAVASFFTSEDSAVVTPKITELLPTFKDGTDKVVNVHEFMTWLERAGFHEIQARSIGDKVWERFVEWRDMTKEKPSEQRWLEAYHANLLDYFIITASKKD